MFQIPFPTACGFLLAWLSMDAAGCSTRAPSPNDANPAPNPVAAARKRTQAVSPRISARTALMEAAIYGHTRRALELLEGKADPQAVDGENRTALFHAVIQGSPVAFLLLERTNRLDAVDAQGENVLHAAVRYRQKRCFYAILNHPGRPNLNARTHQGATALLVAVFARQNDLAQELVHSGADVNIADEAGVTPLMAAAAAGKKSEPHLVKFFLEHGANIHARDVMGRTALFYAVGKGWLDTVSLLLDAGASPDVADATGHRVVDYTFGDGIPEERERIRRLLSLR